MKSAASHHAGRRLWLFCCGLVLWLGLGWTAQAATDQAGTVLVLTEAVAVRADTAVFPDPADVRLTRLPEVWDHTLQGGGPVWYRLTFQINGTPQDGLLGAYIEQICSTFEMRLNNRLVFQRESVTGGLDRPCLAPVLAPLPGALLVPGLNTLDIKLHGQPLQRVAVQARAANLGPVQIGTLSQLTPLYQARRAVHGSITLALYSVVGTIGAAALVLALLSKLPYLAFFGAASVGWSALLGLMGADLPLPDPWNEWLLGSAPAPVAVCAILFLLRYCGLRLAWLELILWLQCLMVPLSLLIAMPERLHAVAQPWNVIWLLELAGALGFFLWRAWHVSREDFWIIATALAVLFGALGLELSWPGTMVMPGKHAVSLALLEIFAGMAWRMHQVFRNALAAAEHAKFELENRVQHISNDMEQNFNQMAEMRVEQVAAKERKRIAADLHDDLGAKLLTIVHTSDNERIATLAREALEEMRLSVRGLTGRPMQLGDALGDWRSEVMGRLSQSGIELVWNIPDDLLMSERKMSARVYVQTTRILREAVSNLLKHSGASHCDIVVQVDVNDFELIITDNGKGIPMELDGKLDRGHGMSTMKSRAKQLQGQCLVESGPGYGTTIRLTLPL
ncbi:MAG: ATP-binding protein [Leptothrix sp. (in: b-proteobacteria)]